MGNTQEGCGKIGTGTSQRPENAGEYCSCLGASLIFSQPLGAALRLAICSVLSIAFSFASYGQNVFLEMPFASSTDSFFENVGTGIGFGFRGPASGGFFRGPRPAIVGNNLGGDASFGFGHLGGGMGLSFNLSATQGSSRQFSSVSPALTVANGATGQLIDATFRPFVIGAVPVIGARHLVPLPATRVSPVTVAMQQMSFMGGVGEPALGPPASADDSSPLPNDHLHGSIGHSTTTSTAERGDIGVSEIRRQQKAQLAERQQEVEALVARAREAQEEGKLGAAKILYKMALKRAQGPLKRKIAGTLKALNDTMLNTKSR